MPYENYRKVFRISQKNIEKELGALQAAASDLASRAQSGEVDSEEAMRIIDGMSKRAENLKRKVHCSVIRIPHICS